MDKHRAIIKAAQPLFSMYGLKKVTTDDIAQSAKVSKATIYKLFKNKQEILRDIVRYEWELLLEKIESAVGAETSVEDKLCAYLLAKIGTVHALINLHRVTKEAMSEYWEHSDELRRQFLAEEAKIIAAILKPGVASGELNIKNVKITSHMMVISLRSLEHPWALEELGLTMEEQINLMLATILNGLRKR